jgi:hypothetical protein
MKNIDVLKSAGTLLVYRKDNDYFMSETANGRFRRLKTTKHLAEYAEKLPQANFIQHVRQLIDGAQQSGSPNYYQCADKK